MVSSTISSVPTSTRVEVAGVNWIENLLLDVRYAARGFGRNRTFTAIAILTLALGIGVNTAVFSMINSVLLRKPAYSDFERLVTLRQKFPKLGDVSLGASPAEYLDYRDRVRTFSSIAGYENAVFDLTSGQEPARVEAARVTYTLFSTLGVLPLAGRTFYASEDLAGGAQVALMSYDFWQRRFGSSPQTIGSVIRLNEQPYTVIGHHACRF